MLVMNFSWRFALCKRGVTVMMYGFRMAYVGLNTLSLLDARVSEMFLPNSNSLLKPRLA